MSWLERVHETRIHGRRVRRLAEAAARLAPPGLAVLDLGCGDGRLGAALGRLRPDLKSSGAEVAPRRDCQIPVSAFDGRRLPFADGHFGAVLLADVLHHAGSPALLLGEAIRVAREVILLKDHDCRGWGARATLRFMDGVGNRRHGVPLPDHYLAREQWRQLWAELGLTLEAADPLPGLYPFPANLIFGRNLHFFARLRKRVGR
jgi:SAM-dependent methyltransferase